MATRVPTFKGALGAFRTPGIASASAPYLSIFNKTGSGVLVAISQITIQGEVESGGTANKTVRVTRISSAPTDGTLLTPVAFDTTQTHNANVEIRGSASADSTNGAFTSAPGADNLSNRHSTYIGTLAGQHVYQQPDLIARLPQPDDPVILREGEGIVVAAGPAGLITHFYEFNVAIEEFNYEAGAGVTGTGGVAFSASLSGSGLEKFIASGGVAFSASLSGSGLETFTGTGGVAFSASLSGSGTHLQNATGTGGVAFSAALSGSGTHLQNATGTGGVAFSAALSGSGLETFTGTGGVAFSASLSGSGLEKFIASGGVAFSASLSGSGLEKFIVSGGVVFSASLSGSGLEKFIASGGVVFSASLSGSGSSLLYLVGSGGVAFGVSLSGSGGLGLVLGPNSFRASFSGAGLVLAPSGSSLTLRVAMILYFQSYDLLTTELERRALQRQFVGRWGVYPVRIA